MAPMNRRVESEDRKRTRGGHQMRVERNLDKAAVISEAYRNA